eukprot:scaffold226701_cov31-Tisochrysis_lutea.AAC.4
MHAGCAASHSALHSSRLTPNEGGERARGPSQSTTEPPPEAYTWSIEWAGRQKGHEAHLQ